MAGIFGISGRKILLGTGSWGRIFCWILRWGGALVFFFNAKVRRGKRRGRNFFNAKARRRKGEEFKIRILNHEWTRMGTNKNYNFYHVGKGILGAKGYFF